MLSSPGEYVRKAFLLRAHAYELGYVLPQGLQEMAPKTFRADPSDFFRQIMEDVEETSYRIPSLGLSR